MSRPPQENLRAELEEAIAKVRHQIDVQRISDHYIGSADVVAEELRGLQTELDQLQDALANLK